MGESYKPVVHFMKRYVVAPVVLSLIFCGYPAPVFAETTTAAALDSTVQAVPSNTVTVPTTQTLATTAATPKKATKQNIAKKNTQKNKKNNKKSPAAPGPMKPTGADSATYTFNPSTGLWESQHYTWNPVTHQSQPKDAPTYSYNPATGMWDTTKWLYNPTTNTYVPNKVSVSSSPQSVPTESQGNPSYSTGIPSQMDNNQSALGTNNLGVGNGNQSFNLFYNAQISNNIVSSAASGDALVQGNTTAGAAITGSAQDITTIINLLQTAWSPNGASPNIASFINNIDGNVVGDITIDPSKLARINTLPTQTYKPTNLTINSQNSGRINNDVILTATSGAAGVVKNTTGGDAQTGSATAIANVINAINSYVGAGQSFIGTININGNFNGDILLPPETLSTLLADNNIPKTIINASAFGNNTLGSKILNQQSIDNNVDAQAVSGRATVSHNTRAGNAVSGDASTNITVLNLTGRQIIGRNALLVFVNVFGKWVGMIVNAPAGSTAAGLGGGIGSNITLPASVAAISGATDSRISNNIAVSAHSGDAIVNDNTIGGNAVTGAAKAGANIANIINNNISLSDWFGVLFINVFGSWNGSFGVNTAAGNPIIRRHAANSINKVLDQRNVKVFEFIPNSTNDSYGLSAIPASYLYNNSASSAGAPHHRQFVLASTTDKSSSGGPFTTVGQSYNNHHRDFLMPLVGFGVSIVLLGIERVITLRQKRYSQQSI